MKQTPNDFNGGSPLSPLPNSRSEAPNFSTDREELAIKQARKWFAILLIIGLGLGGVLAVGVVKIMKELGLTEKPNQLYRIDRQPLDKSKD